VGRLLLGLLLLLLAFPWGVGPRLVDALPSDAAELRMEGLSAPVRVTLDEAGVPRIQAAGERDAAIAMGYLHARDRLFQMEMMRRGAEGRLAEVAGSAMLRLDRFSRTLGLKQARRGRFRGAGHRDARPAGGLCAGRECLDRRARALRRAGIPGPRAPEPWQPQHSLLWAKVMGLWLSGNWRTELERARLGHACRPSASGTSGPPTAARGGPMWRRCRAWSASWPPSRNRCLTRAARGHGLTALSRGCRIWRGRPPARLRLQCLGGGRLAQRLGRALLASDPHLGYGAPILWYLARIELADGRMLAGATAPGTPLMIIGRNADLAWGFTTTHSDTQDVFFETPADVRRTRTETIAVRGAEPVTLVVRETANGPVISDLDETPRLDGRLLSVRMANLEPGDSSARGILMLNRARNIAEARAAAALIASPPQNLMVADRAGGIAMYLTGRTPIRAEGDGSLPTGQPALARLRALRRDAACREPRQRRAGECE
jgi:penicillin G amidase